MEQDKVTESTSGDYPEPYVAKHEPISDQLTWQGKPRCQAKAKQMSRVTGAEEQCKKTAVPGATVCPTHGGSAPQVRAKAAQRLLSLVDPAISRLEDEMGAADKAADRIKAANSILDRAGVGRTSEVTVSDAHQVLAERVREMRERAQMEKESNEEA